MSSFVRVLSPGALVLIELVLLSFVYMYAFGVVKIQPSTAPGVDSSKNAGGDSKSLLAFYVDTYRLFDVYGTHRLTSEIRSPLTSSNAV